MPGSLQVFIIDDYDTLVLFGPYGAWSVDGGDFQTSGTTITGLSDGPHTVSFEEIFAPPSPTPVPQIVIIEEGLTTVTTGTYAHLQAETILETGVDGLKERPLKELDTVLSTPLFFAASSMDASFSGFPGNPYKPLQAPGFAYEAAAVIGAYFDEGYDIMLEGGQIASDLISQAELEAIAMLVEPYLTPAGEALPGGVPIVVGYELLNRAPDSWIIQRGKGFSLITALNAGYITGIPVVMYSWEAIGSMQMQPQTVAGFAVAFNGLTYPTQTPTGFMGAPINGMPSPLPGGFPMVSGYPASGGANISQPTNISAAISIHTVNDDDSINAAMLWCNNGFYTIFIQYSFPGPFWEYVQTVCGQVFVAGYSFWAFPTVMGSYIGPPYRLEGVTYDTLNGPSAFPSPTPASSSNPPADYFNPVINGTPFQASPWFSPMPPAYYSGSPDWQWTWLESDPPPGGVWTLSWMGTNPQINTMDLVMIFWIGLSVYAIPQIVYAPPNSDGPPVPFTEPWTPPDPFPLPSSFEAPNVFNTCAPQDRNAKIVNTSNGTISPFTISLTLPASDSIWTVFNLQ